MEFTRAEVCIAAASDSWRGAGEVLAHAVGTVPVIGARLARLTHSPDLVLSDGEAFFMSEPPPLGRTAAHGGVIEAWTPFRGVFDVLQSGRRQSMMGASQLDRYGNQNISAIGEHARPTKQLLGVRGAPGNTVNHRTSYWVPRHSTRVFVENVDVVAGVGHDNAAKAGPAAQRYHDVHRVVTDLGVFDFAGPDHAMRAVSLHPGVTAEDVVAATGFDLDCTAVPDTRLPTDEELRLLRDVLDPDGPRDREVRR